MSRWSDCRTERTDPPRTDFAAHAAALGCAVFTVNGGTDELTAAYRKARAAATNRPAVVVVHTDPTAWTESGAWWEVGVPETSAARADLDRAKVGQLRYLTPSTSHASATARR